MLGSAGMSLLPPPKLIASCTMGEIDDSFDLVECDSKVLVVFSKFTQRYSSNNILVYRLDDLILDRVVPVTSIGSAVLSPLVVSQLHKESELWSGA